MLGRPTKTKQKNGTKVAWRNSRGRHPDAIANAPTRLHQSSCSIADNHRILGGGIVGAGARPHQRDRARHRDGPTPRHARHHPSTLSESVGMPPSFEALCTDFRAAKK